MSADAVVEVDASVVLAALAGEEAHFARMVGTAGFRT
jgi:hypothetical protein